MFEKYNSNFEKALKSFKPIQSTLKRGKTQMKKKRKKIVNQSAKKVVNADVVR